MACASTSSPALVSELNRQVFSRLWELVAPQALRENSCLIVMGSEGRGEQIIRTDQDNGLLLRDGFAADGVEAVTEAFSAALAEFGYPPCPGGIMLSRPLWRQSTAGAFRDTMRDWIHGSDPEGLINLAIFLDATAVAGDATLLEKTRATTCAGAVRQRRLLCPVRQGRGAVRRGLVDPAAGAERSARPRRST